MRSADPGVKDAVRGVAADESLSGVVRIDVGRRTVFEEGFGHAHRGLEVVNSAATQFAVASGSKGFTALCVMHLVEQGRLGLDTTARSILGTDLPLIDDRVTVEHLLAHRSGIGDYLDEDTLPDDDAYVLQKPPYELVTTVDFLPILDGHRSKFGADEQFSYCNGAYVVLALLAERASGRSYHDQVDEVVFRPAGMPDSAYLRSDALPGRAARGYLDDDGLRTNVFHLPVRGNGDGGAYTTAADMRAFWTALTGGRIVSAATLADMARPRTDDADDSRGYGLGFFVDRVTGALSLHGFDTGAGFVSVHDPARDITSTVLSNTSRGAWPTSQRLAALLADLT